MYRSTLSISIGSLIGSNIFKIKVEWSKQILRVSLSKKLMKVQELMLVNCCIPLIKIEWEWTDNKLSCKK